MDVTAKYSTGDKVEVLLGTQWYPGTVADVCRWVHGLGNSYPVYSIKMAGGGEVYLNCDNSSTRPAPPPMEADPCN